MDSQKVEAILGPQTSEETSSVAEIASKKQIPVLSFADATPNWATERWPFLLQASQNQLAQMKAIAAIVQSWEWHQVTVIYEDIDSSATGILPHLSDALREAGAEIIHVLALPHFPSSRLSEELEKLKGGQCRVFVVHLSLELAVHLFEKANKMKMMEKDYIWITTDAFTSLVHSINTSSISSMQGILGVRSHFPEDKPKFQDFCKRFRKRFGAEYPEEDNNHEPGALAVQTYDAVWSVALAMEQKSEKLNQKLLRRILLSDFDGLTGKVEFMNQKVAPAHTYQIINLMGKSYRELGFWTYGLGFSDTIIDPKYNCSSMKDLGQVFWPGAPWYTPKGWTLPAKDQPLRIGVPIGSEFQQYVNVEYDELRNFTYFGGFSIELFKALVEKLPFYLPYNFIPFNGSYDDLVKQLYLNNFAGVVGDVAIVARRCQYADFTHPYTESGLVMIVPVQKSGNKTLLFLKPFTRAMWILVAVISIYNGFVVWLIERNHWPELTGSTLHQTGTFFWLSFNLHVISQTYTANLTSMLTARGLEPTVNNIETLQSSNAIIGYSSISFVARYLEDVLEIMPVTLKVEKLEPSLQKVQNWGSRFNVCILVKAFPKGSPLLPSVIEALLKVSESGKLRELETSMIASEKCMEVNLHDDDDISSLSHSGFWMLMLALLKHWENHIKQQFNRRVGQEESSGISSDTHEARFVLSLNIETVA
ncbi:glutamate receptor [Citrus sinensis]|uniref:Glutamate receptor n=1 Tax=Citrus sinensis TaxID=2711 RepID=A0ACB8NXB8_CITSI|nr:glutamate receptor [Citrus sinensis]